MSEQRMIQRNRKKEAREILIEKRKQKKKEWESKQGRAGKRRGERLIRDMKQFTLNLHRTCLNRTIQRKKNNRARELMGVSKRERQRKRSEERERDKGERASNGSKEAVRERQKETFL